MEDPEATQEAVGSDIQEAYNWLIRFIPAVDVKGKAVSAEGKSGVARVLDYNKLIRRMDEVLTDERLYKDTVKSDKYRERVDLAKKHPKLKALLDKKSDETLHEEKVTIDGLKIIEEALANPKKKWGIKAIISGQTK